MGHRKSLSGVCYVIAVNENFLEMELKAMVLKKGKRKLIYNETVFFWYVRKRYINA